ncbi:MAG: ORF6N domain-containing protein [Cyanobacteriota bacterium]
MLNQAVKRNINRFPADFIFQLTDEEWKCLISQIVITLKHLNTLHQNHMSFRV